MHTKRKGELSEQKVIARLIELGVNVFTPVGENTRADLIYVDDTGLNRVQVKSGRHQDGKIKFNCAKVHSNSTSNSRTTYDGDVDYFIVHVNEPLIEDGYFCVPIEEANETEMWLRTEEVESKHAPKNSINWHHDYLLRDYIEVKNNESPKG